MKQVYFFLFTITLLIASCAPKATEDTTKDDTKTTTQTDSDEALGTVIIKGGIPSPQKEMRAKIGDTKITIGYGSPSVKGRTVWGDLVPFDEVWRTGANEATTFETSTDLKIQGKELPAGKYGLFTIPTEAGDWTVIFNSVHEQWGAYKYEEAKDVLRVSATPETVKETSETMEFTMEGNTLSLHWDELMLSLEVSM